jgi:hypothetical protein
VNARQYFRFRISILEKELEKPIEPNLPCHWIRTCASDVCHNKGARVVAIPNILGVVVTQTMCPDCIRHHIKQLRGNLK